MHIHWVKKWKSTLLKIDWKQITPFFKLTQPEDSRVQPKRITLDQSSPFSSEKVLHLSYVNNIEIAYSFYVFIYLFMYFFARSIVRLAGCHASFRLRGNYSRLRLRFPESFAPPHDSGLNQIYLSPFSLSGLPIISTCSLVYLTCLFVSVYCEISSPFAVHTKHFPSF